MTLTERAKAISLLSRSLAECVEAYDRCKGNCAYSPVVGYENNGIFLDKENSAGAIDNRIKVLRAELMKLSKEL